MKIKHRLLLTHGLLVFLCLLIVLINLISYKGLQNDGIIINNAGKLRAISYNMAQLANMINGERYHDSNIELNMKLKTRIEEYDNILMMLNNSEINSRMDINHDETIIKLEEVHEEWNEKFKPSYLEILEDEKSNKIYSNINEDIDSYVDSVDEMVTLYSAYSTKKVARAIIINAVLIIFIIVVTVYSLRSTNMGIRTPIKTLMRELQELSITDDDLSNKLDNINIDEISEMAEYFNAMKYDQLTRSLNRRSGIAKLHKLLEYNKEEYYKISLCFIDINDLKIVNDELGHKLGDDLIINVVNTIREEIRKADFIIRMGGDEFMIIFKGIDKENSEKVWDRINNQYQRINEDGNKPYLISVSHGIIQCDNRGDFDLDSLIKEADEKMYAEKRLIKEKIKGKVIK